MPSVFDKSFLDRMTMAELTSLLIAFLLPPKRCYQRNHPAFDRKHHHCPSRDVRGSRALPCHSDQKAAVGLLQVSEGAKAERSESEKGRHSAVAKGGRSEGANGGRSEGANGRRSEGAGGGRSEGANGKRSGGEDGE